MDDLSERMIVEVLHELELGQSAAEILKRYPQHEDELHSILETAVALSNVRVAHSLAAQAESRQQMLDHATALRARADQSSALFPWLRRMTLALGSLLIVIIIAFAGLFLASAEALPGDILYSTKKGVEDLRLSLTTNPSSKEALQQSFDEERILEIRQLLESGRQADVSFEGLIESIDEDTWIVAGLQLLLTSATEIDGEPLAGRYAWIEATTSDGQLIAKVITVEFIPEPSPSPEPTKQDAEIIIPEDPPTATPTPTLTATTTPTPGLTSPETPAEVNDGPETSPAETPTILGDDNVDDESGEGDNDNQDGNEDDDDNSNDNDDSNDDDHDNDDDDNDNDGDDDDDNDNDNDNDDD